MRPKHDTPPPRPEEGAEAPELKPLNELSYLHVEDVSGVVAEMRKILEEGVGLSPEHRVAAAGTVKEFEQRIENLREPLDFIILDAQIPVEEDEIPERRGGEMVLHLLEELARLYPELLQDTKVILASGDLPEWRLDILRRGFPRLVGGIEKYKLSGRTEEGSDESEFEKLRRIILKNRPAAVAGAASKQELAREGGQTVSAEVPGVEIVARGELSPELAVRRIRALAQVEIDAANAQLASLEKAGAYGGVGIERLRVVRDALVARISFEFQELVSGLTELSRATEILRFGELSERAAASTAEDLKFWGEEVGANREILQWALRECTTKTEEGRRWLLERAAARKRISRFFEVLKEFEWQARQMEDKLSELELRRKTAPGEELTEIDQETARRQAELSEAKRQIDGLERDIEDQRARFGLF